MALAVTALVLVSLIMTASRGAIGVGLALLPLLAAAWWPRSRMPVAVSALVVALVAGAVVLGGAEVIRKHSTNAGADNVLAFRDGIWRVALAGWARYPWFGVGMDNYSMITPERVRAGMRSSAAPPTLRDITTSPTGTASTPTRSPSAVPSAPRCWLSFSSHGLSGSSATVRGEPTRTTNGCLGMRCGRLVRYDGRGPGEHHASSRAGMLAALLLGLWLSRLPARRAPQPPAQLRVEPTRSPAPLAMPFLSHRRVGELVEARRAERPVQELRLRIRPVLLGQPVPLPGQLADLLVR